MDSLVVKGRLWLWFAVCRAVVRPSLSHLRPVYLFLSRLVSSPRSYKTAVLLGLAGGGRV